MNWQIEILGEFFDKGYTLQEYADCTIEIRYKEQSVAAFSQIGATKETIREACRRHEKRLNGIPIGAS